ncbi:MAG: DNA polymerase-like protein [Cytophagales bacterium]|nr:MAG: DNA polymerase-like protein [Cytophagales bacterium]
MLITSSNAIAESKGVCQGMVLADARAIIPELQVLDDRPDLKEKLLTKLAEWCICFSPIVAIDLPDGLLLDASGCTHLWGGDQNYVNDIGKKLHARGYDAKVVIADTIGVAWGTARFNRKYQVVSTNDHLSILQTLPPEALRLENETVERLHKLGLHKIQQIIKAPRASLRRRFGQDIITKLNRAIGTEIETIVPIMPVEPYQERLPCIEPIATRVGIEIVLEELLKTLCGRLTNEQLGLRTSILKCYRIDGKIEQVDIVTSRPSHNIKHLFQLFELKLQNIDPGLGIELFLLEAPRVEDHLPSQEKMWEGSVGLEDVRLAELLDRLGNKIGTQSIHRYLPDEHYWPERSVKLANSLQEKPIISWRVDEPRPVQLLHTPEPIEVTAPIPDYPPMLFIYKGKEHRIVHADGPERIEQEWWLQQGQHRDYYRVEDEEGNRYWLFRLGHYHDKSYKWFLHGFFA